MLRLSYNFFNKYRDIALLEELNMDTDLLDLDSPMQDLC